MLADMDLSQFLARAMASRSCVGRHCGLATAAVALVQPAAAQHTEGCKTQKQDDAHVAPMSKGGSHVNVFLSSVPVLVLVPILVWGFVGRDALKPDCLRPSRSVLGPARHAHLIRLAQPPLRRRL